MDCSFWMALPIVQPQVDWYMYRTFQITLNFILSGEFWIGWPCKVVHLTQKAKFLCSISVVTWFEVSIGSKCYNFYLSIIKLSVLLSALSHYENWKSSLPMKMSHLKLHGTKILCNWIGIYLICIWSIRICDEIEWVDILFSVSNFDSSLASI